MKYVYMLRVGKNNYKIGVASDIFKRVKAIQTSNASPVEVVTAKLATRPTYVEKQIHRRLATLRADGGTEWFTLSPDQAIEIAIAINTLADVEPAGQVSTEVMLQSQRAWQKSIDRKLDILLNGKPSPEVEPEKPIKKSLEDDVLIAQEIIRKERKASTSLLQRRMSIGYGKASRIIDTLEAQGFISEPNSNKAREILA